jgi:hypothetical protein
MSKKAETEKALQTKEVADLITIQDTYAKQIDEKFAAVEGIADPAEKIAQLLELQTDIGKISRNVELEQRKVALRRTLKEASRFMNRLSPGLLPELDLLLAKWKLQQNPDVRDSADKLKASEIRTAELLAETVATCDLEEAARSTSFDKVKGYGPLRDRLIGYLVDSFATDARNALAPGTTVQATSALAAKIASGKQAYPCRVR